MNKIILSSIFTFFCVFILNTQQLKSNDNISEKYSEDSLSDGFFFSFLYSKIYVPIYDDNIKNLSSNGNNFFGFSISPNIKISNRISMLWEFSYSLGNLYGNLASDIGFIPYLVMKSEYINIAFGSGVSILSTNSNNSKYGGLGSKASILIDANIVRNFQIELKLSYNSYPQSNYNTMSIGLKYLWQHIKDSKF